MDAYRNIICMEMKTVKIVSSRMKYLSYRDEECLKVVVNNLLPCMDGDRILLYSRETGGMTFRWKYNSKKISNYRVVKAIDWLEKEGYVFNVIASKYQLYNEDKNLSYCYPTSKFINLFYANKDVVENANRMHSEAYPVLVVKDENKNLINYKETKRVKLYIDGMEVMNATNNKHVLTDLNGDRVPTEYCRVFNYSSLDINGRMYNQNIMGIENRKSKDRHKLMIDGSPVVECDFSALHTRILAALYNFDLPEGDLYYAMLPDDMKTPENRQVLKLCANSMLNVNSDRAAMASFRDHMDVEGNTFGGSTKLVLDYIYSVIGKLKDYLYEDFLGLQLCNYESMMMTEVVTVFAALQKAIFPIHDSAIVKEMDKELLQFAMSDAFKRVMGYSGVVPMSFTQYKDGVLIKGDCSC